MPLLSIILALHVLAATFWAGSTFALARMQGKGAELLYGPQMGAAAVTILAGTYLWFVLLSDTSGHVVLGVGAFAAVVAALEQAVLVGRVRGRIASEQPARSRAALAHRVAAGLLAITVVCMVVP